MVRPTTLERRRSEACYGSRAMAAIAAGNAASRDDERASAPDPCRLPVIHSDRLSRAGTLR